MIATKDCTKSLCILGNMVSLVFRLVFFDDRLSIWYMDISISVILR